MGGDAVSPTEAGAILGRALNSQKEHKKAMNPRSIFSDWIEWGCSWGWPSKALLCRFPGLGLQALEPRRLWWDLQWQTFPNTVQSHKTLPPSQSWWKVIPPTSNPTPNTHLNDVLPPSCCSLPHILSLCCKADL